MLERLALRQRDVPAGLDEFFERLYHLDAEGKPEKRGTTEGLRLMAGSGAIQICSNP